MQILQKGDRHLATWKRSKECQKTHKNVKGNESKQGHFELRSTSALRKLEKVSVSKT